jgi:hypothetical protein
MSRKGNLKRKAERMATEVEGIMYLTIGDCCEIFNFNRTQSCIYKWISRGILERSKDGPEGSKYPVLITLESVEKKIDTFYED